MVALILLEIAAVGNPLIDLSLTEEEVRVAAENYAISTLVCLRWSPLILQFSRFQNCTTLCSFVFDVIHIVLRNFLSPTSLCFSL